LPPYALMARVCKHILINYAPFTSNSEISTRRSVMRIWLITYSSLFPNRLPASNRVLMPLQKRLEPSITSQLDFLLIRLWNPTMDMEDNLMAKNSLLMRVEGVESVIIIKGIIGRARE